MNARQKKTAKQLNFAWKDAKEFGGREERRPGAESLESLPTERPNRCNTEITTAALIIALLAANFVVADQADGWHRIVLAPVYGLRFSRSLGDSPSRRRQISPLLSFRMATKLKE